MTPEALQARTEMFARRIVTLCLPMLGDARTNEVARHLLRAGTGVNANYRSAQRGRSHDEVIARLGNACDDLSEAKAWLDLLRSVCGCGAKDEIEALRGEAGELASTLGSACRSALPGVAISDPPVHGSKQTRSIDEPMER